MSRKKIKIQPYTKEKHTQQKKIYQEKMKKNTHSISNNLKYIIKEAWLSEKLFLISSILIILTETGENLAITYTNKYIIELVLRNDSIVKLSIVCLMLIIFTKIFRWIKNSSLEYEDNVGVFKYNHHFMRKLIEKNITIDYENNEKTSVSNQLQKARNVTGYIMTTALRTMRKTATCILNIFAYGGIVSILNPVLLPIVVLPAVAGYYINRHKMKWVWNMADNWQDFERQLQYIEQVGKDFSYAKDIRIFSMQRWFDNLFTRSFKNRLNWYEQQDLWEYKHDILELSIQGLGNFLAYAYVIYEVYLGSVGVSDFVLFVNAIQNLSSFVRSWCDNYSGYRWISENICYVRDYYDIKDSINHSIGKPIPHDNVEIEFRDVSYTYYKSNEPTIKNVSFKLHKGEKLALVGLNGAGKTTIIKLMCGLYSATSGEILIDGVPIDEYNREEYFQLFSTVFQDITTLPVTIAENISSSKSKDIDIQKVYDCLKKSGLYDKVMSLPNRENTLLGKSIFKDAVELSGGQLQKLALAKALYKDAPILLLDEPTSALDPIAEHEMYLNYAKFSKGKSSIFISHRLSSTRFCNRILLIEEGKIVEEGTHAELMSLNGKYAELFNIQSSYYNSKGVKDYEI